MNSMNTLDYRGSKILKNSTRTTGTPRDALASTITGFSGVQQSREDLHRSQTSWKAVIDELLRWRKNSADIFEPEDEPTSEVIETAIDFCHDFQTCGYPMPLSMSARGNGGLTFLWREEHSSISVEILESGLAEFTEFRYGKLVSSQQKARHPTTRAVERGH